MENEIKYEISSRIRNIKKYLNLEDEDISTETDFLYELNNKEFAYKSIELIKKYIDEDILNILISDKKSKELFRHLRAILREVTNIENSEELNQIACDNGDRLRYYKDPIIEIGDRKFIISNDWYYETHNNYDNRTPFVEFINNILNRNIVGNNTKITIDEEKDRKEIFKKYYYGKLEETINYRKEDINLRKEFVQEYPLSRIKEMSWEEYAMGKANYKETLSYKIEFGKYKRVGMGIGGATAAKHGVYWNANSEFVLAREKISEDMIEQKWSEFRDQLYAFLVEYDNLEYPIRIDEKYYLLKGMSMVLTKLLYFYYPQKFLPIASKTKLIELFDYFEYELDYNMKAEELNFILNKNIRNSFEFVNSTDSQNIGDILWNFITDIINKEDKEECLKEDDEPYDVYPSYSKEEFLNEVFINEEKYNSIVNVLENKKNIILEGAPGVGKTFMAKKLAYSIIGKEDKSKIEFVQFHQSYSYEDFVEGYRPTETGFKLMQGVFYNFCKKAEKDLDNKYYLIIDEINRGNLSKIFGELLMLIEKDKRSKEELTLVYSQEKFSVPNNIYIIGLMNTADRSLALIDYALRRRFSFIKIEPAFDNEKFKNHFVEKYGHENLKVIDLLKELNKYIEEDKSLGIGFKIGHSYFCNTQLGNRDDLINILNYEIKPLLEEYWYDEEDTLNNWKNAIDGVFND